MAEIGRPVRRIRVVPERVEPAPRRESEPAPGKRPAEKEPVQPAKR